jgi:hypothetical protein
MVGSQSRHQLLDEDVTIFRKPQLALYIGEVCVVFLRRVGVSKEYNLTQGMGR